MESQINELIENREQLVVARGGMCRGETMGKGGQNVHTSRVHALKHSIPRFQGQFYIFCCCCCYVIAAASFGLSELNFLLFLFGKGRKLWFLSEITSRWLLKLTKVPTVSAVRKSGLLSYLLFVYLFIHFWLHWVFIAAHGLFIAAHRLSLGAVRRGCFLGVMRGFSLWWLLLLQSTDSSW